MPNIKSAKKRVKVSEKKNLRNRMIKSAVRTSVKKLEAAIAADPQTANAQLVVTTVLFGFPNDKCAQSASSFAI